MPVITFDFDAEILSALRKSPADFAREMRIAAAVQWYAERLVSQGKAAKIAGLPRAEFIMELSRRKVPVSQETAEEIAEGMTRAAETGQ